MLPGAAWAFFDPINICGYPSPLKRIIYNGSDPLGNLWVPEAAWAFFDPIITSYEAQSMKPHAGIYELAAKRVNLPPEEIFFVDDRAENVEGARKLGWQAVRYTTPLRLANDLERRGVVFNR